MKNRLEFFNHMAAEWDEHSSEKIDSLQRVVEEARIVPGLQVLDVGAGTGVLVPYLNEKLLSTGLIVAIDYAGNMIEKLRGSGYPPNVRAEVMDIHSTPYNSASFDRILANSCYPHFEDKPRALGEIHRLLNANGLFILSHPTGREHVNSIHRNAHEVVQADALPHPDDMLPLIEAQGFDALNIIDEPEFFLMLFEKKNGQGTT